MHIVVTGASSGIGRAIAKELGASGHLMSLVARRAALLEELRSELNTQSIAIEADLGKPGLSWIDQAEQRFGPVDMLVNNAGTSYVEAVEGVEPERVQTLFQINVHTPIAAIQRVLPAMLARRSGTIVNVASNAAFSPAPYFCHYTATKGALGNFSESLRMEIKSKGVHVVSVYPGPIHTPMGDRNWLQLKAGLMRSITPTGDPVTLAKLVRKAIEKKSARVIYPKFYALGWWFPGVGRFIAEHFVPEATGEKTPPLEGDRP